ncbi:hypothetical protein BX600DRAFT_509192 [Xylariales sp. PMI_506]|nr:hypothetical protein BX600DRAFT_509192 [Xylariales sp. PMI_506]
MQFGYKISALLGFISLVTSAPVADHERYSLTQRGVKGRPQAHKRDTLSIGQGASQGNIIIFEQSSSQQQLQELEFAAFVQEQVALATQLDDIKNNIRINHFKARFSQVNSVIVVVQTLVDTRSGQNSNRYLINQLLADNGHPGQQVVVMVSDAATLTIGPTATAGAALPGLNGTNVIAQPTQTPSIANFDPNVPFGQLGQTVILPLGAQAPQIIQSQIFTDPALIIFPNQKNLFVEDSSNFLVDCALQGAFFGTQGAQTYSSFGQLAAGQAGSVIIVDGSGNSQGVPAAVIPGTSTTTTAAAPVVTQTTAATDSATAPAAPPPATTDTAAAAAATVPAEPTTTAATTIAAAAAAPAGGFTTITPP